LDRLGGPENWYEPCGDEKFLLLSGIEPRLPCYPARRLVTVLAELSSLPTMPPMMKMMITVKESAGIMTVVA
jgi:hypothetical protein